MKIQGRNLLNTLVKLAATINILTHETCSILGITTLKLTSTLLELADRSVVKPKGTLEDIIFSVDS